MIIKRLNNGAYGVVDLLNGHVLYVGTYCECVQRLDSYNLELESFVVLGSTGVETMSEP